jgi:uncharacterized membrane protein
MTSWWRHMLGGLLVLVPAWATYLILSKLISTVNHAIEDLLAHLGVMATPAIGFVLFIVLLLLTGTIATHVIGRQILASTEHWIENIPIVRSVYLTLKGMTDLFQFRNRFGRSTVVAFPFPRNGLWALGFVMGAAPARLQIEPSATLCMVFVPTAVHPFTGYLAFVPERHLRPLNLLPEDAMKMEFSAGLYQPRAGWLQVPPSTS